MKLTFELVDKPTRKHTHCIEACGMMKVYRHSGDIFCGIVRTPYEMPDGQRRAVQQLIRIARFKDADTWITFGAGLDDISHLARSFDVVS